MPEISRFFGIIIRIFMEDPEVFGQVTLDPEVHTLVWPNGADFDPATLHDWPLVVEELTARARTSASTPAHH